MAKYFLGSVGKAEAFRKDENGNLELAFVSKTLTDSGLNISTTKDDIRAGQGAPIQFSFYHDPSVEITLTDVLWKKEYLAAQLGAKFESGSEDYVTDRVKFKAGVLVDNNDTATTYAKEIKKAPIPCGEDYLVWGSPVGADDWRFIKYNNTDQTLKVYNVNGEIDTSVNGEYCIRYLGEPADKRIMEAEISSLIIPEELFLIITAPIFAGDACAASKGQAAGHITFEVPRFQLNGAQEFSMNMSQNQTMSLAGTALATTSEDCESMGGKLLRIIEVIDHYNYKADVANLIVAEECMVVGRTPLVYAEMKNGTVKKLKNSELTFAPALDSEDKFASAGTEIITLVRDAKLGGNVTEDAVIAAE